MAEFETSRLPGPKRARSSGSSASKRSFSSRERCSRVSKATGKCWRLDQRAGVDAVRGAQRRPDGDVVLQQEGRRLRGPADPPFLQPLVEVQLHRLAGGVEVDLGEHVVAGHHQRLERVDAPLVDADPPFAGLRIGDRQHGVEQPLEVVGAVAHAAEEAVAQQVVHLVDVELAGDDLGEQPLGGGAAPVEQAADVGGPDAVAVAGEDRLDLGAVEQPAGHLLVVDPAGEQVLGGVAERRVPEVVEERRGARQPPLGRAGRRRGAGRRSWSRGRRRPSPPGAWRRSRGRSGCARRRGRPGR